MDLYGLMVNEAKAGGISVNFDSIDRQGVAKP
jgi:hypothetical protein